MKKILLGLLALIPLNVHAYPERFYQNAYCITQNGRTEVVLPNRNRIDCLTASHALEFDFAKKWAEAIGQSLNYAMYTHKKAGIVLIIRKGNKTDMRNYRKLVRTIKYYKLPIEVIKLITTSRKSI
jgi:hypothetical protein